MKRLSVLTGILMILIVAYHYQVCNNYEKKFDAGREYWINELTDIIYSLPGLTYFAYERDLDTNKKNIGIRYSTFFMEKSKAYLGIKHVPWDKWSIEEKMYLCAYGSSGNKLNKQDLKELTKRYGVK